ncbi:MAG: rhomboid family intramembrane serine protease [Cytophagales bacterium]|nr:rhomboid family intramembrane serine protease [Cytophagales bacterium]MDW8384448.1 rhomboid family intramembrane serine protease [Flammeovirgaceae bacterium]
MNTFLKDLEYAWSKPNNAPIKIIIINVVVFVFINLIWLICRFAGNMSFFNQTIDFLSLPPYFWDFLLQPWALITYFFTHQDFFHLVFNMLALYWFGIILNDFLGSSRITALYILGGIAGGIAYLLLSNTIPFFERSSGSGMIGASGSVYAIVVAAATLSPDFRMNLLLFGPVKIKYIAAVYVFLSIIGTAGANSGGNIAHLGGALLGYMFIKNLQRGRDWSLPFGRFRNWTKNWFKPKRSMKVTVGGKHASYKTTLRSQSLEPTQEVIDAILDKISVQGYEKLTNEEKQILFRASQKK